MRKCNAILTALILVLFLLHAVLGGFQLLGTGDTAVKALAWTCLGLIAVHVVLSSILTAGALKVWKRTGVSYFRENRLFWARRISGLAVMLLLAFHLTAFGVGGGAAYRLRWFDAGRLAAQLLLAAALAVHILTNIRPMLIAFGVRGVKPRTGDALAVLSVLLLFMAAAFIVYYLRWNTF